MGLRATIWLRPSSHLLLMILFSLTDSSCGLNSYSARKQLHASTTAKHELGLLLLSTTTRTTTEKSVSVTTEPTSPLPIDVMVGLHETAHLLCNMYKDSKSTFSATWRRYDRLAVGLTDVHEMPHRYSHNPLTGDLTIANVRQEDGGLWQCEELDRETGELISSGLVINLIVTECTAVKSQLLELRDMMEVKHLTRGQRNGTYSTEPPQSPYLEVDGRRLDPDNALITVKDGVSLSVWCFSEGGNPPPMLTWKLSTNKPAPPLVRTLADVTKVVDGGQRVRSEAHFSRVVRKHHNATVTCSVHHITLPKPLNASVLLDVEYPPSFFISREPGFGYPLIEGFNVSLKCEVDSNPPSNPLWVKDDGPLPVPQPVGGFLNFTSIHREHSGWYRCTSREFSSVGYFFNVRYNEKPELTLEPGSGETNSTGRHIEVALGGAIQLECPYSGVSCWSRVGSGGTLEPLGMGPELSLEKVLYQEAGSYRCISGVSPKLEEWTSLVDFDISVTGAPAVYPLNKSLVATTGQPLSLSVEFCANPAPDRVFWLTDRLVLMPGDTSGNLVAQNITDGSSPHCHQAVLTLRTVRMKDAREYMLLVRSPGGIAEGSIMVNVTPGTEIAVIAAGGQLNTSRVIMYGITVLGFILSKYFTEKHIA